MGELLRAIDAYTGQPITRFALALSPHVFVRPGELRQAEWAEFDFDAAVWRIPAARMKKRREHVVPLSRQSLAILGQARALSGGGRLVFPALGKRDRCMSENTVNLALRRMGFGANEMTAHGFRAMASTLLNESGKWSPDAIERALAHKDSDQVRAAYHRGRTGRNGSPWRSGGATTSTRCATERRCCPSERESAETASKPRRLEVGPVARP
ncbi:tyrosine-type recombinase/integrase [Rubellimicrobium mesophilum]|uniref:tyrosine-type recombinase/integrase n=1 Tax=Rubellimicrobium mesophilum TaxID=1123067 RepID=UPI003CCC3B8A